MRLGPIELLRDDPILFVILAVSLVAALTLHEWAHAAAAEAQGDRLPRASGRLSLNPARHLDPLGTLMILLVGFGWAKPVQFRPSALRSKRFGAALVALAGPLMNVGLALAGVLAYAAADALLDLGPVNPGSGTLARFCVFFITINVILALFNLIPLPPLDGSRLLTIFLPPSKQRIVYFLDTYGFVILLGLVFFAGPWLFDPIAGVAEWLLRTGGAI